MSVTAVKFDRIGAGQKPKQTHPREQKHQVASGISESGHITKSLLDSPLKRAAYRPSACQRTELARIHVLDHALAQRVGRALRSKSSPAKRRPEELPELLVPQRRSACQLPDANRTFCGAVNADPDVTVEVHMSRHIVGSLC